MIKEFLLHLIVKEKCRFLWDARVSYLVGYLGKRNIRVFRGVERDPSEVWSLMRFQISLWASFFFFFCIYTLVYVVFLLSWKPGFVGSVFIFSFLVYPCIHSFFFSMKVVLSICIKINK